MNAPYFRWKAAPGDERAVTGRLSAASVQRTWLLLCVALVALALSGCATSTVEPYTPVIAPNGGTSTAPVSVQIYASDAPGGAIHYTLDGSVPTASSPTYSSAFTLSSSATVKAVIVTSTGATSPVTTATFSITLPKAATPGITPAGGNFVAAQPITIADATSGATIYYTTDGSTPTSSSMRYSTAFSLNSSSTVQAIATAAGYLDSDAASASFTRLAGTGIAGTVRIGKQAVAGANVQLVSAGTAGYGSASTLRSTATATTDATGNFALGYSCASSSDQLYLVSRGGTPAGRTAGSIANLELVTALGSCATVGSSSVINEVTTIAAAYALARFVDLTVSDGAAHIGTSATNATGIANAFLTANVLANTATGTVAGPSLASTTVLPSAEINSLAAILASCGSVTGSDPCAALLAAATVSGTAAPTDSFMAAVTIARHPGNNVASLFALASGAAYTPVLAASPADWTLALSHSGGGIARPTALGVDSGGNVWAASYAGAVAKLSPQGAPISPSTGYTGGGMYELLGLTIDPFGNIWVTSSESAASVNSAHGQVQKLNSSGTILSGSTGYGGSAVYFPEAAASHSNGNIWIANYGNSTGALLNNSGTALTPSGGLGTGTATFAFPISVATDTANGAWFTNQGGTTVTYVNSSRVPGTPITCCNAPSGIALDASGNLWIANFYGNSISLVQPPGTVVSAGYSGGGIAQPQGIAIDGDGSVWIANYRQGTLSELQGTTANTPGTPISSSSGLGSGAGMSLPNRVAVDASGNLWASSNGNDRVVEFVGIASPVKTPLIGLPMKP